jgi:hypothetical protein
MREVQSQARHKLAIDRRLVSTVVAAIFAMTPACSHCGLGLHASTPWSGSVAAGASVFQDFPLSPQSGAMEIDLASTSFAGTTPGTTDAYLTDPSCAKLFDGPYPGSAALCKVLIGPTTTGKVSPQVGLDAGTYRVWVVGYSSNPGPVNFLIDVDLWDSSCRPPLSQ